MDKKVKFNGMDVFITVAVALVIAAAGILLFGTGGSATEGVKEKTTDITFTVELTARDEEFTRLISIGDTVLVGEKEKTAATVSDVEILPAKETGYDIINGQVLRSVLPGQYDVNVTLEAEGVVTDEYIKHGTLELKVGQGTALSSKSWTGYGYVIKLDEAE